MLRFPVKVWVARLRSATFEERAASESDPAGRETEPAEMVRPFAPVIKPWAVKVLCVAMAPSLVVVAVPLIERVPEV